MTRYNVTLSIAHDPITCREPHRFEDFAFTFSTFAEVQAFAKEKLEDQSLSYSAEHIIYVIPERDNGTFGRMMRRKYTNWEELATGDYSNMDETLYN